MVRASLTRLLQLRHVLVVVVADDKRDALFGLRGRRERRKRGCDAQQRRQSGKPSRH